MSFYDKHMDLINEVVEFVRSGPLFVPVGSPSGVRAITDFEQAKHFCWDELYGNGEYTWTDLREKLVGNVYGIGYRIDGFKEEEVELHQYTNIILNSFDDRVDEKYERISEDATADLSNCLIARAIQGKVPGFFESMFDAYKQGLWPCGWDGNYPEGRLIAYVPS